MRRATTELDNIQITTAVVHGNMRRATHHPHENTTFMRTCAAR